MAFLGRVYKYDSEDNFDGFLKSTGIPDDQVQRYLAYKPTSKLDKDGDVYTYTTVTAKGEKKVSFKSGVEFEDKFQDFPIKNIYSVDGTTVVQTIKTEKGDAFIKREYVGDQIIVTITTSNWDGVAKRYYKAV